MTKLQSVRNTFLERTVVTNLEKKYLNAAPFNVVIEGQLLGEVINLWVDHVIEQHIEFDAVVGLPDAGNRYSSSFVLQYLERMKKDGMASEKSNEKNVLVLPAKKHSYPASWSNVAEYVANSFTAEMEKVPAYIGGVVPGQKVLLVDDVIARGDTAVAAIKALWQKGAIVVGILVVFDKIFQGGYDAISEIGVPVFSPIRVEAVTEKGIQLVK